MVREPLEITGKNIIFNNNNNYYYSPITHEEAEMWGDLSVLAKTIMAP